MTNMDPVNGADFYKIDTLSRSRSAENDTLFSGTSPHRKTYENPPPGFETKYSLLLLNNYAALLLETLTQKSRGKSLLRIAYVIFVILKSHDLFL